MVVKNLRRAGYGERLLPHCEQPAFDCPIDKNMQEAYNFAIDPYGEIIHCDEGPGDTEKMAVISVDTQIVQQRREQEGPDFNLYSRIPQAYHRLVQPD